MPVDPQVLETLSFFKDLKLDELQEFASLLSPITVKKGDIVIKKGTHALKFFIVYKGKFEISAEHVSPVLIEERGGILGWSTVVAPFKYMGTVTALENGELLYISSQDFMTLIQGNNKLGEKVVKIINKTATERRAVLSSSK